MRIAAPIETRGLFWLPDDPENRLSGTLSISERGKIRVEAIGLFNESMMAWREGLSGFVREIDLVLGIVEDGGKVTLERCFYQPSRLSLSGGLSGSTFLAEMAFIGANFESQKDMIFSKFRFSMEGLDEWLYITGIEMEQYAENNGGAINYHLPDEITLNLSGGVELEFLFNLIFPNVSLPMTEASVTQKVFVHVKTQEPKPKEEFFSLGHKIRHFLSLALGQDVSYQSIEAFPERGLEGAQENPTTSVRVYGQFRPWSEQKSSIAWHNSLFQYKDVEDRLEEVLTKWTKSYKTLEPVLNLYFATRQDTSQDLDVRFLQLAQGIEALHRRGSPKSKMMSENMFKEIQAMLSECCPPEHRHWLEGRLRFGNEPTLAKRLDEMIRPFKCWFGNHDKRKGFIREVVDTRNYFTHLSEELEGKEAKGQELLVLYEKLEALFQLHLLRLVGFQADGIDSIIRSNYPLRRKLGVEETD